MTRRQGLLVIGAALAGAIVGTCAGIVIGSRFGVPFLHTTRAPFSIGIYTGPDPLTLSDPAGVSNPVIALDGATAADPFLVRADLSWFMFFEVNRAQGDIGLATSDDGLQWEYAGIVLDEPFHLSYPQVFHWQEEYYMLPEAHESGALRLYRAARFPGQWEFLAELMQGQFHDPTIFHYGDRWWLLAQTGSGTLRLFLSEDLLGPWREHPESPVVEYDPRMARPAGRVVSHDDRLIRFAQDGSYIYGHQVRAFEITELSPERYRERALRQFQPVLRGSGEGWNGWGMHHIDAVEVRPGEWIAAVDGFGRRRQLHWGF